MNTTTSDAARCLDLTRLLSRIGRGTLTGVDRVELAYLREFLRRRGPVFGLAGTGLGFLLVGRVGLESFYDGLVGRAAWGRRDLLGLFRGGPEARRRAEAQLRRNAIARSRPAALAEMLARHLPPGTAYFNVGHSNLGPESLEAWRQVPDARVHVMVHDVIPLDFPQFQRPGTDEAFARKLQAVSRHADAVICNSEDTRLGLLRHFRPFGPEILVAHLGHDHVHPQVSAIPAGLLSGRPFFVILGTIEPRKNHAFLLDVWEELARQDAEGLPDLLMLGNRGWANEALFRRLAQHPLRGTAIHEAQGLGDAAVAALLREARGLLFPSHAEGFGLPALEAAAVGTPVLCNTLPVFREILGDIPVYAPVTDMYLWCSTIRRMAEQPVSAPARAALAAGRGSMLPDWGGHFDIVLGRAAKA